MSDNSINTIVDCVFDIFFESDYVAENFLNIISTIDDFEEIIKLPLHQIPDAIRKNDPNLKLQPLYEIRSSANQEYKILLGDNTIGIAINDKYSSWSKSFFPQIQKIFSLIFDSKKIKTINRMGLRYVDFLEDENIFDTGKIKVDIDKMAATDKKMFLRIEDQVEQVSYNKVITNKTQHLTSSNTGSIVDIVTYIDTKQFIVDDTFDKDDFFNNVDKLHNINKDKFKEVIDDERIRKYGL